MPGSSEKEKKIKKYLPLIFLSVITISLMFYFKENRGDFGEIVNKGTDDLLSIYTNNLKPLLFGTELTNEDVFNFALYQTLPIDKKENKVLRVSEIDGETNYEVIPGSYKSSTENYQNFIKYMGLSENQKTKLDSILESYQPELAEAVFTDGDNTYAVNSRLSALQKAVLTDIAAFSRDANKPKLSSLFGNDLAFVDSKKALSLIDEIKRDTTKEFLIISKDTAFTSRLEYNRADIRKELEGNRKNNSEISEFKVIAKSNPKAMVVKPQPPKRVDELKNDLSYSYSIPNFEFGDIGLKKEAMDSLKISLNELTRELKNISFNFNIDSLKNSFKFDMQNIDEDSLHSLSFEFNFENLGEIINKSIEGAMSGEQSEEYWENFGMQMDSLANAMVKAKKDSMELSEEMKKKLEQLKRKKK